MCIFTDSSTHVPKNAIAKIPKDARGPSFPAPQRGMKNLPFQVVYFFDPPLFSHQPSLVCSRPLLPLFPISVLHDVRVVATSRPPGNIHRGGHAEDALSHRAAIHGLEFSPLGYWRETIFSRTPPLLHHHHDHRRRRRRRRIGAREGKEVCGHFNTVDVDRRQDTV